MKTTMRFFQAGIVGIALGCAHISYAADAPRPDDSFALKGVEVGKVAFDITPGDAKKLALFLKVIAQTHADLLRQNVKPDMVLVFHGAAVQLITSEYPADLALDDEDARKEIASILADLHHKGVRIEACSIATELFKVNTQALLPGIVLVGNTFVSQIGYQAKGYAIIPVN